MRLLRATMRVRLVGIERMNDLHDAGQRYVFAFWHCQLLLMVFAHFRKPLCVMISRHKDGEYIARTVQRFGIDASRGSSTRGGSAALKELIAFAAERGSIAITPDGPRGPRCVAAAGVVRAAQATGLPLIPAALVSERKKRLRSWDRFEIPMPFSRAMFMYGEPLHVPAKLSSAEVEEWRATIERKINELVEQGETSFDALYNTGITGRQARRRERRKE